MKYESAKRYWFPAQDGEVTGTRFSVWRRKGGFYVQQTPAAYALPTDLTPLPEVFTHDWESWVKNHLENAVVQIAYYSDANLTYYLRVNTHPYAFAIEAKIGAPEVEPEVEYVIVSSQKELMEWYEQVGLHKLDRADNYDDFLSWIMDKTESFLSWLEKTPFGGFAKNLQARFEAATSQSTPETVGFKQWGGDTF